MSDNGRVSTRVLILGSTGSIGVQALEVIAAATEQQRQRVLVAAPAALKAAVNDTVEKPDAVCWGYGCGGYGYGGGYGWGGGGGTVVVQSGAQSSAFASARAAAFASARVKGRPGGGHHGGGKPCCGGKGGGQQKGGEHCFRVHVSVLFGGESDFNLRPKFA